MTGFLILAFLILIAGVLAVPLATRIGLGSVLGYLLAGMAISPLLAALSVDVEALQVFAEFGVVMMLFIIGLEMEPRRLWAMRGIHLTFLDLLSQRGQVQTSKYTNRQSSSSCERHSILLKIFR